MARRSSCDRAAGFSLVEVVAAMVIFAIAALSIVVLVASGLRGSRRNTQHVQAAQAAAQVQEQDRDAVKNSVPILDSQTQTVTIGGVGYQVTTTASWVNVGETGSACTGAVPGDVAYRRIVSSVTWPNMVGTSPVTSATIATPLSPSTITIPVQLVSANKTAISGQTITLTPVAGGTSTTETTDSNGCVIFAQLTPAKYYVNVNIGGYVDATSVAAQNHTDQVGQTVPGITQLDVIYYDRPATLNLVPSFTNSNYTAATYPFPASTTSGTPATTTTGLSYTLTQTGWSDGTTQTYPVAGVGSPWVSTSTGTVSKTVFPFQVGSTGSGYGAYAGVCSASASATTPVSTALGTPAPSGAATLNLPVISQPIVFARTTTSSTKFPTGTYKVTAYDSPDGCSDSYVLPSITLSGSTSHTLATDKFSLPAGKYIFTLVNGSNTYVTSTVPATSYTSFTTSTTTNTTVTTTS